jgi:hypothetical protein
LAHFAQCYPWRSALIASSTRRSTSGRGLRFQQRGGVRRGGTRTDRGQDDPQRCQLAKQNTALPFALASLALGQFLPNRFHARRRPFTTRALLCAATFQADRQR